MERIVVGSDLTARSGAAVHLAADLARAQQAVLHLVTACRPPVVAGAAEVVPVPDHRKMLATARLDLEAMAVNLRKTGLDVETHVCDGEPSHVLCEVARTVGAELIVVGNRRMQGPARLLGSVPNRVAHHADCNVLIARTG